MFIENILSSHISSSDLTLIVCFCLNLFHVEVSPGLIVFQDFFETNQVAGSDDFGFRGPIGKKLDSNGGVQ